MEEMIAGEQQEDAGLKKILELCQSGDPAALQQIGEIVQGLLAHNQEEEQGMKGGDDMAGKVMERIKANRAGNGAPQE